VRRAMFLPIVFALALVSGAAFGDITPADRAQAERLFEEGNALVQAGKHVEACPKYEAVVRLTGGIGAMLELAHCYETTGRTASAWAMFRQVLAKARLANQNDRASEAEARAKALEPGLLKLRVQVRADDAELEVRLDGRPLERAAWDVEVPVDPGEHRIEASAPGKNTWSSTFTIDSKNSPFPVSVPALDAEPPSATDKPAGAGAGGGRTSSTSALPADVGSESRAPSVGVWVLGGVGVVGLGASAVLGLMAKSKWDDAHARGACDDSNACTPDGHALAQDAQTLGTIATVSGVVGIAALGGAAVLYFASAPSTPAARRGPAFGARVTPLSGGFAAGFFGELP
jgi:hypothetical protein